MMIQPQPRSRIGRTNPLGGNECRRLTLCPVALSLRWRRRVPACPFAGLIACACPIGQPTPLKPGVLRVSSQDERRRAPAMALSARRRRWRPAIYRPRLGDREVKWFIV